MRHRVRLPVLIVVLLLAMPVLLWAHGALRRSDPAANATLAAVPRVIHLTFTEPAELAVGRIELTGPDGRSVPLSPIRHGDSNTVLLAEILGALEPGRYTVGWQVAGRDGHPVRGTFWFVIAEGADGLRSPAIAATAQPRSSVTAPDTTAPVSAGTDEGNIPDIDAFDAESPLFAVVRWIGFVGLMALVGTAGFLHLLIPGALRRQAGTDWAADAGSGARAVGLGAVVVLLVALLLRLAAQTAAVHGSIGEFDSSLVTGTSWGRAWLVQLAGIIAAGAALLMAPRAQGTSWFLAAATIVVAASFALSGHAAAVATNAPIAMAVDTVHILGAGGWIGTLLLIVAVGIPAGMRLPAVERGPAVANVINAFSPLALVLAGTAALTGTVSAALQLGAVSALWSTQYGQRLLLKLGFVLLLVGAGAYNSYRVRPSLGEAAGGHRIKRSATVELAIAALVLVITAVLVATPTGASAP